MEIRASCPGKSGSVTIGSLISEARECGWVLPEEKLSGKEIEKRKREAAARREEAKRKALAAEKAREDGAEEVAKATERIVGELTSDSGTSPYLDAKKVKAFRCALRGASLPGTKTAKSKARYPSHITA